MTHCILCKTELTEDDDITRGYDAKCRDSYRRLLRQVGTTEFEIREMRKLSGDDLADSLRLFEQSLHARQLAIRQRAFDSLRRHAVRAEVKQFGLTADEAAEYMRRRMAGDSAQELRDELESANRGLALERELYLAEGVHKLLYALMEKADTEINRVKERDFIKGYATDDRNVCSGMQIAVVTAIAYADADPAELIEFANRQGWGRVSHFIQRNLGWIAQERSLQQGIARRLREDDAGLRLAA